MDGRPPCSQEKFISLWFRINWGGGWVRGASPPNQEKISIFPKYFAKFLMFMSPNNISIPNGNLIQPHKKQNFFFI